MPTIFLSYRRADSMEVTGRIYDRLVEQFGAESVFRDIDSIPLGVPFPDLLNQTLSRTDAVLVILGPTWLTIENEEGQRRLGEPGDFVRMEVETALRLDLPIIPVTVSGAKPNLKELPQSIASLADRNGIAVRPDPDFHRDMDRLCTKLQEALGIPESGAKKSDPMHRQLTELIEQNTRIRLEIKLQNELSQIERDWENEQKRYRLFMIGPFPTATWTILTVVLAIFNIVFSFIFFMTVPVPIVGLIVFLIVISWVALSWYQIDIYQSYQAANQVYNERRNSVKEQLLETSNEVQRV